MTTKIRLGLLFTLATVLAACGAPPAVPPSVVSPSAATPRTVPSSSTGVDDTSTWTRFTSERYGFSAALPSNFGTRPSTRFWVVPETDATSAEEWDMFGSPSHDPTWTGSSIRLPGGMTEEAWADAYRQGQDDPAEPAACNASTASLDPVTVDGRPGSLRVGCGAMEVLVVADGRVYSFAGWTPTPTVTPGVPDEFRLLFEAWLTTIKLDPVSALEPPVADPTAG